MAYGIHNWRALKGSLPNVYTRQCYLTCLTSLEVLYQDVCQAKLVLLLANFDTCSF